MKLLIAADLVPTKATEENFAKGNIDVLFGKVKELAEKSDRFIVNLECALTDSEKAIRKIGPNLKGPIGTAKTMKKLGVTEVALANNHVFDYGTEGLSDTMSALEGEGLPYFGIGENDTDSRRPYFFEADGKKIAIVNVCEHEYTYALKNRMGANPFDPFLTMQDIRAAKAQADFLIVLYHGGKEYSRYPSPRLYNLCHEMVYCGADVVIAQHSHCVGCYEQFEGAHILYGQGNFNFSYPEYSKRRVEWKTGLLVSLDVTDDISIEFTPIYDTGYGCDIAEGDFANQIMSDFEERNVKLLDGRWLEEWENFCQSDEFLRFRQIANGTYDDPNKVEMFAHFLDCEAHTDVWRVLCKTWHHTNEV